MKILTKILPQTPQNLNYVLNHGKFVPNIVICLLFCTESMEVLSVEHFSKTTSGIVAAIIL